MALARFERDFTDDSGNLLTGNVTVAVAREAGGPQVVYSDRNGTASLGSTWVQSGGAVAFYAIGGAYRITVTQGAFSRELRYVPIGTKQEEDAGSDFAGFTMSWETGTAAPPSAGSIRANNATLSSATSLFVSEANLAGSDIATRLGELVAGDRIMLTDRDGRQASWNVDAGGVTDSGAYRTIAVTSHAGETSFSATSISMQMQRKGAAGSNGTNGTNGSNGTNGVDGKFSGTEVIKTAAYTALAADSGKTIILNKATADVLSFDAAATLGSTWMIMVKNIGAGTWTLDPNGAELIDGASTISLAQGESCVVASNGTALRTFFRGSASASGNSSLFVQIAFGGL